MWFSSSSHAVEATAAATTNGEIVDVVGGVLVVGGEAMSATAAAASIVKVNLQTISQQNLEEVLAGERVASLVGSKVPKFRAKQILHHLHSRGVKTFEEMSNNNSKNFRTVLPDVATIC